LTIKSYVFPHLTAVDSRKWLLTSASNYMQQKARIQFFSFPRNQSNSEGVEGGDGLDGSVEHCIVHGMI
jgi:hypothetical protein